MKDLFPVYQEYLASYNDTTTTRRSHDRFYEKINRIKENKEILLHYHKLGDLLYEHEIMDTFNTRKKRDHTSHEEMLENSKTNFKSNFSRMTGNEHLTNYKDCQESLCNRYHSLMCVVTLASFMGCKECGCMSSMESDTNSRSRAEKNNRKCKYP